MIDRPRAPRAIRRPNWIPEMVSWAVCSQMLDWIVTLCPRGKMTVFRPPKRGG